MQTVITADIDRTDEQISLTELHTFRHDKIRLVSHQWIADIVAAAIIVKWNCHRTASSGIGMYVTYPKAMKIWGRQIRVSRTNTTQISQTDHIL